MVFRGQDRGRNAGGGGGGRESMDVFVSPSTDVPLSFERTRRRPRKNGQRIESPGNVSRRCSNSMRVKVIDSKFNAIIL